MRARADQGHEQEERDRNQEIENAMRDEGHDAMGCG
jgi:hypothetical protein